MSVHSDGAGSSWNEALDVNQPHGKDYLEWQDIRIGVRKRMDQEHSQFADSTAGGIHTPGGSAVLGMEITDDCTATTVADGTYRARGLVWAYSDTSNWAVLFCNTAAAGVSPNPTNSLWAYITEFSWNVGLAIEDQRAVKRLANIDPDHTADDTLDEDKIIQIRNNFKGNEKIYMYCNETVFTQLQILAKNKTNVHWTGNDPFGRPQFNFLDMPVRRCDAITNVEPVLS